MNPLIFFSKGGKRKSPAPAFYKIVVEGITPWQGYPGGWGVWHLDISMMPYSHPTIQAPWSVPPPDESAGPAWRSSYFQGSGVTGGLCLTFCRVLSVSLSNSGIWGSFVKWRYQFLPHWAAVRFKADSVDRALLCSLLDKYPYPWSGLSEGGERLVYTIPEGGRQRGQTEEPRRCWANLCGLSWEFLLMPLPVRTPCLPSSSRWSLTTLEPPSGGFCAHQPDFQISPSYLCSLQGGT